MSEPERNLTAALQREGRPVTPDAQKPKGQLNDHVAAGRASKERPGAHVTAAEDGRGLGTFPSRGG